MGAALNVGIDIGSTTIKVVVLNQAKEIVYKTYERHFSEISKALHDNLTALRDVVGGQRFSFALTGKRVPTLYQSFFEVTTKYSPSNVTLCFLSAVGSNPNLLSPSVKSSVRVTLSAYANEQAQSKEAINNIFFIGLNVN